MVIWFKYIKSHFHRKKCVLPVYCGHSMPLLRKNIFPSTFIKEIILNWVICFNFSSLGIRQPSDYLPYDGIFLFFHFSFNNLHRCLIIFGHFLHTCTFIIWSCFRHIPILWLSWLSLWSLSMMILWCSWVSPRFGNSLYSVTFSQIFPLSMITMCLQ